MPTYEYQCTNCRKKFSVIQSMTERATKKVACPACKSKKVKQLISVFNAKTSRKS